MSHKNQTRIYSQVYTVCRTSLLTTSMTFDDHSVNSIQATLTQNSIQTMLHSKGTGVQRSTIIVQVIHVRMHLVKREETEVKRYLVVLSDGSHFVQGLVSPSCNRRIIPKLTVNDIVQTTNYRIVPINKLLRITWTNSTLKTQTKIDTMNLTFHED